MTDSVRFDEVPVFQTSLLRCLQFPRPDGQGYFLAAAARLAA
jgi:hypothetical protein